jgi:tryptophan synthase
VTVPLVLMGYWNPFMQHKGNLLKDCKDAGVSGFIVVDMPPEEAVAFRTNCTEHGLSYIPLIAPTTTDERLDILTQCADSFIYAVSVTGVTGTRAAANDGLGDFIGRIQARTDVPIAIGFGIGDQSQYRKVAQMGDGVVVGSAIINTMGTLLFIIVCF